MDEASGIMSAGNRIAEFTLVEPLGRGAMGEVWLAEQESLRRRVALKVLHPTLLSHESVVERFRREALNAARLRHYAIVSVLTAGEAGGRHFIAMDYIEGASLEEVLVRLGKEPGEPDPHELAAIVRIGTRLGDALHYAHEEGILHRDVKPGNVLLDTRGRAYLVDFGLARNRFDDRLTSDGQIVGTPRYMAPEQLDPSLGEIGTRTDVYSLASTLYELATLRAPYEQDGVTGILARVTGGPPPPADELNPQVPPALSDALAHGLEKNPEDRHADAGAFARELHVIWRSEFPWRQRVAGSRRSALLGSFLDDHAAEHAVRRPLVRARRGRGPITWMEAVPGGSLVLAIASLLAGIAWAGAVAVEEVQRDFRAAPYPFFFLGFVAFGPGDRAGRARALAMGGRVLAFLGCAGTIAFRELVTAQGFLMAGISAGCLAVVAHLLLDRWIRVGVWTFLAAMVAPFTLSMLLTADAHPDKWLHALHYSTGFLSLFCASSALVILPEYFRPRVRRETNRALLRALAIGVAMAALYFGFY